jgi:hypothetical protein
MREFVFNETMQVGIVVRDLDAAIRCGRNIRYGSMLLKNDLRGPYAQLRFKR